MPSIVFCLILLNPMLLSVMAQSSAKPGSVPPTPRGTARLVIGPAPGKFPQHSKNCVPHQVSSLKALR